MALTARYWTKIFVVFVILSYIVAYLFLLVYMWIDTVRFGLRVCEPPVLTRSVNSNAPAPVPLRQEQEVC